MATYKTHSLTGYIYTYDDLTNSYISLSASVLSFTTSANFSFELATGSQGYDVDITATSGHLYGISFDGTALTDDFTIVVETLHWGAGNATQMLYFGFSDAVTGVYQQYIYVLGGDPLPTLNTVNDIEVWDATIYGDSSIVTGPFSPDTPNDIEDMDGITTTTSAILQGTSGADVYQGDAQNDVIYGNGGSDIIDGGAGNDALFGGTGADQLRGGSGINALSGGAGADTFIFGQLNSINTITDFEVGTDKIDLSEIIGDTDYFNFILNDQGSLKISCFLDRASDQLSFTFVQNGNNVEMHYSYNDVNGTQTDSDSFIILENLNLDTLSIFDFVF
jgi:Ca2+-binding RTX toxin-like protein